MKALGRFCGYALAVVVSLAVLFAVGYVVHGYLAHPEADYDNPWTLMGAIVVCVSMGAVTGVGLFSFWEEILED